jgi:hypothetical protein
MEAARAGREQVFRCLIEHGANIRAQDYEGHSVMEHAAEGGSVEITSMLIDHGVHPGMTSTALIYPLSIALKHKHKLLTNFLLDKLATISEDLSRCYGGALRRAAQYGEVDIVKEVLRRGADPNLGHPRDHSTALGHLGSRVATATKEADIGECARVIIAAGGELRDVRQVIYHLVSAQKCAVTILLLENCLDDSNTPGVDWTDTLLAAITNSQPAAVVRLIVSQLRLVGYAEHDSEVFWEAVEVAAEVGHFDIIDILLQASRPEDANDYARAAISSLGLRREDHVRQYLEERYVLELSTTGKRRPAPTQGTQQRRMWRNFLK